jgi:DNA-binding LytR/AlgR family response regulator
MATGTILKTPPILREAQPARPPGVKPVGEAATGFFFLRCDHKYQRIALGDVRYIEARRNYCRVVIPGRIYTVASRLMDFEEALPSPAFCRIHRSVIVGLSHVEYFDHQYVFLAGEKLKIGEQYFRILQATAPVFNPFGRV